MFILNKTEMKIYYFYILLVAGLTSCNKFLDVKPQAEIPKDELFTTQEGFQEALNGVYTRGAKTDLYGGELTFGLPEVLVQNYTIVEGSSGPREYAKAVRYEYTNPDFISRKDGFWKGLY